MEKIKQALERKILPTLKELREQGESDPEAALIFQALGAASTCWQDMTGTGIFDSDRAKRIGDELLYELRILSEPEGSKPMELTDDAPFKVFESELYKGSFGVRGPHYSVAGLVNMSAAEALADKMNWAFRLGRDQGYLSPPPKEQGAEPYAWTVRGTRQMYFGEYAESDARMEAKKIGGTAVAFPLFRQEQGAEPVDEERELADHYLYMGWLMARGDGPMTEDDVRDAFLHALKYARAHPSPTSREKAMEEAGDAMEKTLNRAWQDLEDWRRQGVALRGESEEGVHRGVLNCIPSDAGIQFTRKIMQECIVANQQWHTAKSTR